MEDQKMDERNEQIGDENAEETGTLSPFFSSAKDAMAKYSHCAICGGNLHFTHMTDFIQNLPQEVAKCPECGVRARKLMHRLQ